MLHFIVTLGAEECTSKEKKMANHCILCNKRYVWTHDLNRHIKNKHSLIEGNYAQQQQEYTEQEKQQQQQQDCTHNQQQQEYQVYTQQQQQQQQEQQEQHESMLFQRDLKNWTVLQRPFTMMISGPTACGKTSFVKDLLQHHTVRIQPTIQRIVWLYKRWQPLYDVIKNMVSPQVEFIQGIPSDLADEDFFDLRINNLLILDDLFSVAGKDKRITDLFTEGSHHRSLSVISISQNLFANKDPTQRRNCHYLVLFNNPIDRQAMMTLGRQMYPGDTDKFQKAFAKATKKPYGYLLVDLKPFTPDNDRLRYALNWSAYNLNRDTNKSELTNQTQVCMEGSIKDQTTGHKCHLSVGVQTDHINENLQAEIMAENAQACNDCGLLFDSSHDVQRHVKRGWCPENNCEPPAKKAKLDAADGEQEHVEENEGYLHLWSVAQKQSISRFNQMYDEYIEDGEDENDAAEMAEERTQPFKEKHFFEKYQALLELYWIPFMINATHLSIVKQIDNLRNKGISLPTAVKRVLKKSKHNFQELFEIDDSDEGENDDDSEGEEESDTE